MEHLFNEIIVESAKEKIIKKFEDLILSGKLKIGDKIPSERELAKTFNISRPIIHEALLELSYKGLIKIEPRKGTFVNDFKKNGTILLLETLANFNSAKLSKEILNDFFEFREIIEINTTFTATKKLTKNSKIEIKELLKQEYDIINSIITLNFKSINNSYDKNLEDEFLILKKVVKNFIRYYKNSINFKNYNKTNNFKIPENLTSKLNINPDDIENRIFNPLKNSIFYRIKPNESFIKEFALVDFKFHHLIAIESNNLVFSLLSSSFKNLLINYLQIFYKEFINMAIVNAFHNEIFYYMISKDSKEAAFTMQILLNLGALLLKNLI